MPLPDQLAVPDRAAVVRRRLNDRLMVVGSVWFPTRSEMHRWHDSPARLYLRWADRGEASRCFEIGPRVETVPAARFCPVLRGELVDRPEGTQLVWSTAFPRGASALLWGFSAALVGWALWLVPRIAAGEEQPRMMLLWAALAVILYGGAAVSWRYGMGLLAERMGWLDTAVRTPEDDGDAWG